MAIGLFQTSDTDYVNYPEYPAAALTAASVTYPSSIDAALTALRLSYSYPTDGYNLPVMIVMVGYHDPSTAIDVGQDNKSRWARKGYFVVYVDTRGGNGASGTFDDGGRETHDIYDAYQYIVTNFPSKIAPNKVSIHGYSRGGGMSLLMAARYPDLFQSVTSYFGISNWGGDATYGWYEQEPGRQANLTTAIGGTPAAKPNEYRARHSQSAIAQNFMGRLTLLHDVDDSAVDVSHSRQVEDAYIDAGRTDYLYSETSSLDADRWTHSYPQPSNDLEASEPLWIDYCKSLKPKTIATSGTLKIIGSVITKRFTVALDDGDTANAERSRIATLVYDTVANSYQVTNTSTLSLDVVVTLPTGETDSATIASGNSDTLIPV